MLHHEESPEKPQYNMATPPFLGKLPIFRPSISINFEKVELSIIDEKEYKDLVFHFVRYVLETSIEMMSLFYHELIGTTEEYDGKKYLVINDSLLILINIIHKYSYKHCMNVYEQIFLLISLTNL